MFLGEYVSKPPRCPLIGGWRHWEEGSGKREGDLITVAQSPQLDVTLCLILLHLFTIRAHERKLYDGQQQHQRTLLWYTECFYISV